MSQFKNEATELDSFRSDTDVDWLKSILQLRSDSEEFLKNVTPDPRK